jgi:hypothetical protein
MKAASEVDASATAALNPETKTKSPSGTLKIDQETKIKQDPTPFSGGRIPVVPGPCITAKSCCIDADTAAENNKSKNPLGSGERARKSGKAK